ncbi:MAG: carbon-nitrogen hydrolase family protein [Anaerolineae bacterium]
MTIRIAVVQQDHNPGQVEANRAKALAYAGQALARGADIILFHEELLIGYHPDMAELAEPADGPTTRAFQALLQGTGSVVVYGLTERAGNKFHIAAPVVSAGGLQALYRKTHLWPWAPGLRDETAFYEPGDELVTFEYRGVRVGIMICYDGDYPEMARAYANRGCALLLWLNNRESRGYAEVRDLAYRNSLTVAAACCCGTDESANACRGGSNITGPDGTLLAEIWDREGFITADVDPRAALEQRKRNFWFACQRPELYYPAKSGD